MGRHVAQWQESSPQRPCRPLHWQACSHSCPAAGVLARLQCQLPPSAAVLASNLGGVTGALLGADGGNLAGRLHLDVLYPVRGRKRCFDPQNGFGRYPHLLPANLSSLCNVLCVSLVGLCPPAEPDTLAAYTGQCMLAACTPAAEHGCCVMLQSSHTRHSGWQISACTNALLRELSEPMPLTPSLWATGGHDASANVSLHLEVCISQAAAPVHADAQLPGVHAAAAAVLRVNCPLCRRRSVTEPTAAFGPAGSTGKPHKPVIMTAFQELPAPDRLQHAALPCSVVSPPCAACTPSSHVGENNTPEAFPTHNFCRPC